MEITKRAMLLNKVVNGFEGLLILPKLCFGMMLTVFLLAYTVGHDGEFAFLPSGVAYHFYFQRTAGSSDKRNSGAHDASFDLRYCTVFPFPGASGFALYQKIEFEGRIVTKPVRALRVASR
ncbi:hypothetical protein ABQG75_15845 [Franconibacter daqui]|uniref:Uncharacterized protein n=1 Tax=Franconibacter daqui TaxID=2047724 RepID=A0ABV1PQU0_9ENTR